MKAFYLSLLLLVTPLLPGAASAQSAGASLVGNWLTTLETGEKKIRFIVKVTRSGDGFAAKFDSPDQGAFDLAIDKIELKDKTVKFSAAAFGMNYEGIVNEKFDEISGTFNQGGGSAPMVFKRTDAVMTLNRPQEPKKPYPYDEEEVTYRNSTDNIKLAGTLTLPRDKSKRYPAVILITGSGSQDRNETINGHKPFLLLADHLTRRGIAVLRVDDRGMGGSDFGSLDVTTENFMQDVLAGVDYLKTRKEIDTNKIGLIGHSEGGMIAAMAAANRKDVAFIVLLAGLGQRGDDVIYAQTELIERAAGTDQATIAGAIELIKNINSIVKRETDKSRIEEQVKSAIARHVDSLNEAQRKSFARLEASIKSLTAVYALPWYRYFIMFDPAPIFKKVTVPVLALNGELDLQVPYKENLGLIESSLKSGGNKDVTVRSFPKLNHLFQTSKTGLPSEYQIIEETMSPDVLKVISDWVVERASK